jgi:hypothetical protein
MPAASSATSAVVKAGRPPKPMAQATHGMHAMDATGHDLVEGDAHLFEYDLDDPGRVTR